MERPPCSDPWTASKNTTTAAGDVTPARLLPLGRLAAGKSRETILTPQKHVKAGD